MVWEANAAGYKDDLSVRNQRTWMHNGGLTQFRKLYRQQLFKMLYLQTPEGRRMHPYPVLFICIWFI